MAINSRSKGKRGELSWSKLCTEAGFPMRRSQQYAGTNADADCVAIGKHALDGWHHECKWTEQFCLRDWIAKAISDSRGKPFLIAHKYNNGPVTVTLLAEEFFNLIRRAYGPELNNPAIQEAA